MYCLALHQVRIPMFAFTMHLSLSDEAYDTATLPASPSDSSVMASVSAYCCAGEVFILVAKDIILGDLRML